MAEVSRGNLLIGQEWLGEALKLDRSDHWALRNLAASLMKQHRFEESLPVIRKCLEVAPDDIATMVAYGDCLEELGRGQESEAHYRAAIKTGGPEHIVDLAKSRLTERSAKALRGEGDAQPEVVRYMRDAIERFEAMDSSAIRNLAFEIAILGSQGLNIKDRETTHRLKAWPGKNAGLHLISVMYAAFQQFAPKTDLGVDLSKEYVAASRGTESSHDHGEGPRRVGTPLGRLARWRLEGLAEQPTLESIAAWRTAALAELAVAEAAEQRRRDYAAVREWVTRSYSLAMYSLNQKENAELPLPTRDDIFDVMRGV